MVVSPGLFGQLPCLQNQRLAHSLAKLASVSMWLTRLCGGTEGRKEKRRQLKVGQGCGLEQEGGACRKPQNFDVN